jgi:spore maturation protein SpmB
MEPSQRKVASPLSLLAGVLAGLAAVAQFWRSGTVDFMIVVVAPVFVLIGLRSGKPSGTGLLG